MKKRTLPVAAIGARPNGLQSDVSPQAMERWQRGIRATAGTDNNVISIMDVIGEDWMGQGITAKRVSGALRAIGDKPVVVEINSPGGDYFEGLAIYNVLREHTQGVTVKVVGIYLNRDPYLAQVGDASRALACLAGGSHRRQEQSSQDRHDGNHHEQFHKCETCP